MRHIILLAILFSLIIPHSIFAKEHTIVQGDTIARIARRHAVSISDLKKLNGVKKDTKLQLGDILIIPERLIGNSRRSHKVKQGDNLAKIAKRYKIGRKELRKLNRIGPNEILKLGRIIAIPNPPGDDGPSFDKKGHSTDPSKTKKLEWAGGVKGLVVSGHRGPGGMLHTVQKGQTLSMIARAYVVDSKKIARKNKISKRNPLKAGMEITVPGAKRPVPVRTSQYKPHLVQFVRVKKTKRMKIKLIRPNGVVRPQGRRALGRLMGYRRMHPELAALMQRIAERFPGRAIDISSGYRKPRRGRKKQSMHAKGRAVDFWIEGVSNELLYEFVSSLDKVGAGYYPNSRHVHLDTRDKKYLWTDVSGRGESANYVEPGETGHFSTIADSINDDGEIVDTD